MGVIHQQCIFHLLKNIKKDIRPILKSEKVSEEDKTKLDSYFQKNTRYIRHIRRRNRTRKIREVTRRIQPNPESLTENYQR